MKWMNENDKHIFYNILLLLFKWPAISKLFKSNWRHDVYLEQKTNKYVVDLLTHQNVGFVSPQRRNPGKISWQSLDFGCYQLPLSCQTAKEMLNDTDSTIEIIKISEKIFALECK